MGAQRVRERGSLRCRKRELRGLADVAAERRSGRGLCVIQRVQKCAARGLQFLQSSHASLLPLEM